ncbi:MAG: MFS transporter [Cyanobacteria bacterium P01_F01_bin.150]
MTHPIGSNQLDPNLQTAPPNTNPFPDLDTLESKLKNHPQDVVDNYSESFDEFHDSPNTPKKSDTSNGQVLLLLFLSVFVDLIGFGVIAPLMPFIAETFGASPLQVTQLFALYSLMQLIFTPFWGYLSDRIGRRPILLMCYLGSCISYVLFAFSPNLTLIFMTRALAGITGSSITVTKAYIADITTPENRAKGMGIIGAAFGCGFMVGPALGGLLAGSRENPNFQLPLLVAAGLALAAFTFALVALPESLPKQLLQKKREQRQSNSKPSKRFNLRTVLRVLKPIQIRRLVSISFLFSLASVGVQAILVLWCERQFDWGPRPLGILFMFYGIIATVIQGGLIGVLTSRFKEQTLLLIGIIFQGFGLLVAPLSTTVALLVLGTSIWVVGESVCRPALNSLTSRIASDDEQGITLGVAQSFMSGANIFGPILAGWLFMKFGGQWSFWAGTIMMIVATILGLQFKRAGLQAVARQ